MEVSGQLHTLADLPPGKEPRLGGPQSQYEEKNLPVPGFKTRNV
jgi:hypothetical protein